MEFLQTTSDIRGRLNKFNLAQSDSVMAIHEAVVNSIQANSTKITVSVKKIIEKDLFDKEKETIDKITVTDNGVGFNTENFLSFTKMDSTYKLSLGGKGIGRLAWLKVFNDVRIESNYLENGKHFIKKFQFSSNSGKEIGLEIDSPSLEKDTYTKIILSKVNSNYMERLPKKGKTLAEKILYHCLMYFMTNDSFDIIVDYDNENKISLREEYDQNIKGKKRTLNFKLDEHFFNLNYLTLNEKSMSDKWHKIKFTADGREVKEYNLKEYNPMFEESFDGEYVVAYLEGEYLNEKATEDRTNFSCNYSGGLFTSIKEIGQRVSEELINVYSNEFDLIRDKNKERVNIFLKENPSYKYIYRTNPEIINKINDKITDDKLEDIFYGQAKNIRNDINKKVQEFNFEGNYQEEFEKLTENVKSLNDYDLAQYILHRKVILTILDKLISRKNKDNEYHLEKDLHNLIFPMQRNGDEVNYEEHNLWLIDDRLSYYNFLSSDLRFSKILEDSNDKTRADLAIYRVAYSDKTENEMQDNITIVELKKPARTQDITYSSLKEQVMSYREKFIENSIKSDLKGRPIRAVEGQTKFHIYIICEISEKLRRELKSESFQETPDGLGCFRYYNGIQTMLEVINFDKLLIDATNRNKIFFKKLGLE